MRRPFKRNHVSIKAQARGERNSPLLHLCAVAAAGFIVGGSAAAQGQQSVALQTRATFERVYVPAYSHVLTREGASQPLASTMVVHNVDPNVQLRIVSVEYLDRNGTSVKTFLEKPIKLAPFAAQEFLVPINEQGGGFGANYILEWNSDRPALPPVVEAVMVGGSGTQGISFITFGRTIERRQ